MTRLAAALALAATGCLGPLVDDTPAATHVLPAGTAVPAASGELAAQIAEDGPTGAVPATAAFSAGQPITLWDLGPSPDFVAPMYVLTRGGQPIDHPAIVDAVPGDAGYSSFWVVIDVEVSPAYDGEVIPSLQALQEAEAAGLVASPRPTATADDYAIVAPDVTLAGRGGPDDTLYVRGVAVDAFDLGAFALTGGVVTPSPRYVLHREGGEPLSEPLRHIDLDGDGDLDDTNDVLVGTTPLCDLVEVAVPSSVGSIDTSGSQSVADLTDAAQLFDPAPTADVRGFTDTGVHTHCAIR